MSRERLGVIGVGYVGLVTAACFARSGYDVVCLDIDEAKLERLRAGQAPIHEPGMEEVLAESRERLTFTSSAAELFARADIAFVCVDTPPSASGDADLSRVEAVLEAIPAGTSDAVLVMKSTVPPGTGRACAARSTSAACRRRLRLEPGVPARGQRDQGFRAPRPRGRRRRRARRWGSASRRSTAPSAAPS